MKYITNLKSENFDSIYSTNASFGNLSSTNITTASHLISKSGALTIQGGVDGGSGKGIYWYNYLDSNWASYFSQSGSGKSINNGVACSGGNFTSWSLRNRLYNNSGNGFIWENSSEQHLMSLNANTGDLFISGALNKKSDKYTQSSQSNASGITLTAAMVLSGLINRTTAGAGQTDTLDSASNFVSAFSSINTGYVLEFVYWNNSSNDITLALGTGGVSINGSTTMTAGKCYDIKLVFTSTSAYYVIIK